MPMKSKSLDPATAVLSDETVTRIRRQDANVAALCKELNLGIDTVNNIRFGAYYKWLNDTIPPAQKLTREQRAEALKQGARKRRCREDKEAAEERREKFVEVVTDPEYRTKLAERHKRAILEGGSEKLAELEHRINNGPRLTEKEWELITRLRAGLKPSFIDAAFHKKPITKYSTMSSGKLTV